MIFLLFLLVISTNITEDNAKNVKAVWLPSEFIEHAPESFGWFSSQSINTVVIQAVKNGTAYYPSSVLPVHQETYYDPLDLVLTELKQRDLKVFIWINTLLVWSDFRMPEDPEHVLNLHPEWALIDLYDFKRKGFIPLDSLINEGFEGIYLDPSNPGVISYLCSVAKELTSKYDIDGIIFDFVRYPSENMPPDFYLELPDLDPSNLPKYAPDSPISLLNQWLFYRFLNRNSVRIENIDAVIFALNESVKAVKPDIQTAATSFPDIRQSSLYLAQNWLRWNTDYVCLFYDTFMNDTVFLYDGINLLLASKSPIIADERISGTVHLLPGLRYDRESVYSTPISLNFIIPDHLNDLYEFNLPFRTRAEENVQRFFSYFDELYYSVIDSISYSKIDYEEHLVFTAIYREDADTAQIREAFRFLSNGVSPEQVCYMFNSGTSPFPNDSVRRRVILGDTLPPFVSSSDDNTLIISGGKIGFYFHSFRFTGITKYFGELNQNEKKAAVLGALTAEAEKYGEFDNGSGNE